jgi:protoheme IX farnesyltransferase
MRVAAKDCKQVIDLPLSTVSDFFKLLKPRVMYLVIFTAFAGMFMAPGSLNPFIAFSSLFAIALGSGASGAFNMWYERDIDQLMPRTAARPIPNGLIDENDALSFSLFCGFLALMIMFFTTDLVSTLLLAFAMFFYAIIYTVLLKRFTPQNIVIGGAAGAMPPIIGWSVVTGGNVSLEPIILFLIIFLWTPPHFWALALKKSDEYKRAGVPMLPNVRGSNYTKVCIVIYSIILILVSVLPYFLGFNSFLYFIISVLLGSKFIYYAVRLYRDAADQSTMSLFWFSIIYLFAIFSSLVVDKILFY